MPNYTKNLDLAKPVPETDVADIIVLNENCDKLDTWAGEINTKLIALTTYEVTEIVTSQRR